MDNVGRVSSSVDIALDYLKLLEASQFFMVYPSFGPTMRAFKNEFAHYIDSDSKYIVFATAEHLSKIFEDNAECPAIVVKCEKRYDMALE